MSTSVLPKGLLAMAAFAVGSIYNLSDRVLHSGSHHHHHDTMPRPERTEAAELDRVTDLPGLSKDGPSFEQFSGYVDVAPTRHVFYWFVEKQGESDENTPVILWTNGGPGCSGLLGLGTEHGPFNMDADGNLIPNPYSWNTEAHVLYVEQPASVGFSYVDTDEDLVTGDIQAAEDNHRFLREFMTRFPERRANPFYLSSESYGGHYMPFFALELLKENTDNFFNFQGVMLGNPYVDPYIGVVAEFEAFYHHGLLPKPLYAEFTNNCLNRSVIENEYCDGLTVKMLEVSDMDTHINPYALDFPMCLDKPESRRRNLKHSEDHHEHHHSYAQSQQVFTLYEKSALTPPYLPSADRYHPCNQVNLAKYLNLKKVRKALHVRPQARDEWTACFIGIKYSEEDVNTPSIPQIRELIEMGAQGQHDLDFVLFSGDDDGVCPTASTQDWIWDMGFNASSMWKPWMVEGQTVGFVTNFDLGPETNATFRFVTIHGAGHEVPAYRPLEALELLKMFLSGSWDLVRA